MLIWTGISGTVFPLFLNLELGISVEFIGLVVSSRTVGIILATFTSGYLSDKTGRKPMIMLGLAVEACSFYVYTLATSFEALILIGLIEGFGRGMILNSIMVLLSEVAPFKYRGGAIGMYRTFMDIGGFIGPLFFMGIFGGAGSNFAFISAIGVIAASMPLILTIKLPESIRDED